MLITAYKMLCSNHIDRLQLMVNDDIKDDWQPYGSPIITGNGIVQTMVRRAPPCSHKWVWIGQAGEEPHLRCAHCGAAPECTHFYQRTMKSETMRCIHCGHIHG